jgi:ferredoxin
VTTAGKFIYFEKFPNSHNIHQRRIAMPLKVTIDTDECIGCQTCVELCPEAFSFDNDTEKAEVRPDMTGNEDCIEEAADSCPVSCIYVEKE